MKKLLNPLSKALAGVFGILALFVSVVPAQAFQNLRIQSIGLGSPTISNPTITGSITGDLIPSANNTYNVGSAAFSWKSIYASSTSFLTDVSATGTISPTVTNTFDLGTSSLFWRRAYINNVSSTSISVNGQVSSTTVYVQGTNGKFISLNPGGGFNQFGGYTAPSTLSYMPFTDNNNYLRGTLNYYSGGLQSETANQWSISATGAVSSTSIKVGSDGSSGTITKYSEGSASLDFGATAAGTCDTLTITVPTAADGDPVLLGIPNALATADVYQSFWGWVSAANTVSVKRCNLTNAVTALSNAAAATVNATVIH